MARKNGTISGDPEAVVRSPLGPERRFMGATLPRPYKVKQQPAAEPEPLPGAVPGFKRGGKVKKTGVAKVHKGERVLTAKQAKKPAVRRAVKAPSGTRKR